MLETEYMDWFLGIHPLRCIGGKFYDVDGFMKPSVLRKHIAGTIKPYIKKDCSQQITKIVNLMTDFLNSEYTQEQDDWIFFANGDYCISEKKLYPKERICFNRLPVSCNPEVPEPAITLKFLGELLEPEDIKTLQEYIGYMFLTSNPAQKMLMILGRGGEGKSQVGEIIKALFGDNCVCGSVADLSGNRFMGSTLECKNVYLDDDMKLSALKDTDFLKKLITNSGKMMLEQKGKDPHQGYVYAKLIAFGNGSLKSLYDRSMGFYRRQIVLTAKKVPDDRVTDPFLGRKIASEAEGILLWALEGLYRLAENNYSFTISDSAKRNLEKIIEEQDTIGAALHAEGYFQFMPDQKSSTAALYDTYLIYCKNNNCNPVSKQAFNNYLSENSNELGIRHSKHIKTLKGLETRGFIGICTRLEYDSYTNTADIADDNYYD